MKLYHGSNVSIDKVDLSKSKTGKDFGFGFYLSPTFQQAKELSERKTMQIGEGKAQVTVFDFDESYLSDSNLNVLRYDSYSREWAEFIMLNRSNRTHIQAHNYDIVIGPIANDAVGIQMRKYVSGLISIDKFLEELKYMKGITFQYFFGTQKAVDLLKHID
jgi:hypothetical protein